VLGFSRADGDRIDVVFIDANPFAEGDQRFTWIGDALFTAVGQLRYFISGINTVIAGNLDNDPKAEFQVQLAGTQIEVIETDLLL
jgi:serralysin